MANRYLYPRGFEATNPDAEDPAVTRGVGDSEVDALFRAYINGEPEVRTWAFQLAAIRCAKRLFGSNLAVWIQNQKESEYVGVDARNYLVDTCNYFKTGNRHMHPRNWVDVIGADPQPMPRVPQLPAIPTYKELEEVQLTYISHWLGRCDGMSDLIYALYICFGSGLSQKQRISNTEPFSPKNPKLSGLVGAITKNLTTGS